MRDPRDRIRVGIIGVNPDRGWASTAHIPALRALPDYELVALSTSNPDSAKRASQALDVALTFWDHRELIAHPDVDLVVVTVKAPQHRQLVTDALSASKAVYCEWPLGIDAGEAEEMAALAQKQHVPTVVGLQGRQAPEIQYVRDLVGDGYVGDVLSTSLIGSSVPGGRIQEANAYMLDARNGANLLSVAFAHGVDALMFVLGEVTEIRALLDTRRPEITVIETGETGEKTSPDQVLMAAKLNTGATASVHYREGLAGGTGFFWEINGSKGTIVVTADGGLPGIFPLAVHGARGSGAPERLSTPSSYLDRYPTLVPLAGRPAFNVGGTYAAFADDRRTGGHAAPDFTDAADRHRFLARLASAAEAADVGAWAQR